MKCPSKWKQIFSAGCTDDEQGVGGLLFEGVSERCMFRGVSQEILCHLLMVFMF